MFKMRRSISKQPFRGPSTSARASNAEKTVESEKNPYNSSSGFFESSAHNLDATKDVGYVRRENGKYGSHASHDSFDDESES
jgi:hypothetical protein